MSELYFLEWLRGRKEAIIDDDNNFQKALDDALNFQNTEGTHNENQKLCLILISTIGKR